MTLDSGTEKLPVPPIASDVDLRDFKFLPLDVVRLRDCAMVDAVTGDEFLAAVLLWCAAWHQLPASSLPDDDRQLAKLAGFGRAIDKWQAVRAGALYGFVKCADGRLYHEVLVEKAREAWAGKLKASVKGRAGALKRWAKRNAVAAENDGASDATAAENDGASDATAAENDGAGNATASENDGAGNAIAMARAMPGAGKGQGPGQGQGQGQGQREGKNRARVNTWPRVLDDQHAALLLKTFKAAEIEQWFAGCSFAFNGALLAITAPSEFTANWIETRYAQRLKKCFGATECIVDQASPVTSNEKTREVRPCER